MMDAKVGDLCWHNTVESMLWLGTGQALIGKELAAKASRSQKLHMVEVFCLSEWLA